MKESELRTKIHDALHNVILSEASHHYNSRHHSNHGNNPQGVDPDKVSLFNDPKVRSSADWAKWGGNFPVERNGHVYYVSRSMAVSLYVFCKDKNGEWCILANQRGRGAQNAQGLWNVPAGYLDYNESAEYAAKRETWEETGVNVPINKIHMMGMNSGPIETDDDIEHRQLRPVTSKQDVAVRFAAVLDGVTDQYPVSDAHCEPGEVADIQWIPLSRVGRYSWAYGQGSKVLGQAKTSLGDFTSPNGGKDDIHTLVALLRREIANNPTASNLFDRLIKKIISNSKKQ